MHPPGESLRQERETRGKTIEEMAAATGIRPDLLTALEQDSFDSLPGRGFGKLYIRAYAEVLGFDPRPVIEAYDDAVRGREAAAPNSEPADAPRPVTAMLARWRQERMAGRAGADLSEEPEEEAEEELEGEFEPEGVEQAPAPEPVISASRPARSWWWPVAALSLLVLPLMAWRVFSRSTPDAPPAVSLRQTVPGEAVASPASQPSLPQAAEAPRTPPRTQPSPLEQEVPPSLEVAESGVGLRLVGTHLEGESDRFRAGQRVTFATRVLGGGNDESIRHVWMRDGKVEQSIDLSLGGASWRTHSTKTLGRPGAWVVEARDEQGRVLARADLTVVP